MENLLIAQAGCSGANPAGAHDDPIYQKDCYTVLTGRISSPARPSTPTQGSSTSPSRANSTSERSLRPLKDLPPQLRLELLTQLSAALDRPNPAELRVLLGAAQEKGADWRELYLTVVGLRPTY